MKSINQDDVENIQIQQHHDIAPMIVMETPIAKVKVDTGNVYLDVGIFAVIIIVISAFIFGKYYK